MEKEALTLISPATLLIRSFTVEYLAKGNLDIFKGMVGPENQGKTSDSNKSLNGRKKKTRTQDVTKRKSKSYTEQQIPRRKYQLDSQDFGCSTKC